MNTLNLYTNTNWLPKHSGNPAYMEHINDLIKKINEIITEDATDNASLSGDNTFAGFNIFSENIQFAAGAYGVTAHAGGGQTGATPLTGMFNSIAVCATNGDSCILPEALAGNFMIVATSEVVVGTPQIYPAVGEQIDTMGANVPLTVTSGTVVMFSCDADGNWVSTSLYDINHIYNAINTAKVEVKPYDVYVGIATASIADTISAGSLTVGKQYLIISNTTGDFTNVGALNNNAGTQFTATGITPTSWGDAVVAQNIEPVVTVFENTLSAAIVWTRQSAGTFIGTLTGEFTTDKTFAIVGNSEGGYTNTMSWSDENSVTLITSDYTGVAVDEHTTRVPIEIRVYP